MRRRTTTRLGRALAVAVATTAAVLALLLLPGAPAGAQGAPPLPVLSPDEFVALLERAELPGTNPPGGTPAITGDARADARIVALALDTHYRLRPQSRGGLTGLAGVRLNPEAADALVRMRAAAQADGVAFTPVSGFRSVDDQRGIFLRELASRGYARIGRPYSNAEIAAGAADAAIDDVLRLNSIPGFSFHHTGNTVDLTAPGGTLAAFIGTKGYEWLSAFNYSNAKKFGFVPSYPVGATAIGPEPEPWEFTYVGVPQLQCAQNLVALAVRSPGRCPVGSLDVAAVSGTAVTVAGWAADADAPGTPIEVHVYLDGQGAAVLRADGHRPDVAAATGLGPAHGFQGHVAAGPGPHQVCVHAVNDVPGEASTLLGCRAVVVASTPPFGVVDRLSPAGAGVRIEGWTADPDVPAATVEVHVYVDGRGAAVLRADGARPDVGAATGLGSQHGFAGWLPVPTGSREVCTYAISPQPEEGNRLLECRRVWSLGSTPTGVLDLVAGEGRSLIVQGWAVDGDLPAQPLEVHLYVDGRGVAVVRADGARPDVAQLFEVGPAHGLDARVPAAPGNRTVCAWAVAAQPGDPSTLLGCRSATVPGTPPIGILDVAAPVDGGVLVQGWAADPGLPASPTEVHLYLDGRGVAVVRADGARPDVGAATGLGADHGFVAVVAAAPGPHQLCAWAIATEAGEAHTLLGCRSVTVDTGP